MCPFLKSKHLVLQNVWTPNVYILVWGAPAACSFHEELQHASGQQLAGQVLPTPDDHTRESITVNAHAPLPRPISLAHTVLREPKEHKESGLEGTKPAGTWPKRPPHTAYRSHAHHRRSLAARTLTPFEITNYVSKYAQLARQNQFYIKNNAIILQVCVTFPLRSDDFWMSSFPDYCPVELVPAKVSSDEKGPTVS